MRDCGLNPLRQDNRDAISTLHTQSNECIRKPVGAPLDLPIRKRAGVAGVVFIVDGESVTIARPTRAALTSDIETRRYLPVKRVAKFAIAIVLHAAPPPCDFETRPCCCVD